MEAANKQYPNQMLLCWDLKNIAIWELLVVLSI